MADNKTKIIKSIKRTLNIVWFNVRPQAMNPRSIGALMLLILGLGRIGLLPIGSATATFIPQYLYGFSMIVCCMALYLTMCKRTKPYGRLVAAISFAILGGFAIDILPAYTSSLLMIIPTYALLGEVGARYEYN